MDSRVPVKDYDPKSHAGYEDRLAGVAITLGREISRRGFLQIVARGAAVVTGAAVGLFEFGGVFGTDVRDAFACWICATDIGACECTIPVPSVCFATDGTHKTCFKQDFPNYDCVRAYCASTTTSVWICPKVCTWCSSCPIAC